MKKIDFLRDQLIKIIDEFGDNKASVHQLRQQIRICEYLASVKSVRERTAIAKERRQREQQLFSHGW